MSRPLLAVVLLGVLALSACGRHSASAQSAELPVLSQIPDFSLTDQNGHATTRATLAGHVWILDFVFTNCIEICPLMTRELGKVREALGTRSPIWTVTITVDPTRDKPTVLKQYAEKNQAMSDHWLFLTGDIHTIVNLMKAVFVVKQDATDVSPSTHSTRFILMDRHGQMRATYRRGDTDAQVKLVRDAQALETAP